MKRLTFEDLIQLESGVKVVRIFNGEEISITKIGNVLHKNSHFVYFAERVGSNNCICVGNDKYISDKYHNSAVYVLFDDVDNNEVIKIAIEQIRAAAEREIKAISQLIKK